jgi:hypothetical protein
MQNEVQIAYLAGLNGTFAEVKKIILSTNRKEIPHKLSLMRFRQ